MKKIRILVAFSLAVGKRSEGPWAPLGHLWCWVNNNNVTRKKEVVKYKRHNAAILVPSHVNVDMILMRKGE